MLINLEEEMCTEAGSKHQALQANYNLETWSLQIHKLMGVHLFLVFDKPVMSSKYTSLAPLNTLSSTVSAGWLLPFGRGPGKGVASPKHAFGVLFNHLYSSVFNYSFILSTQSRKPPGRNVQNS